MIDQSMMITLLTLLDDRRELAGGVEENQLFNEMNLRTPHRAVTTELLNEHLGMASDKGWCDWSLSMLKARRWRITPSGRAALEYLKAGG